MCFKLNLTHTVEFHNNPTINDNDYQKKMNDSIC